MKSGSPATAFPMALLVKSARFEAPNIVSYDLRNPNGGELPPFAAGAHIDLALPNGMTRSYSLINSQTERHRFVVAVQNDRASRGGSRWIHANLRPGNMITVSGLRNNFALNENAERSIFIAGGIGITPILNMSNRLTSIGRRWELYYCCRTPGGTPFLDCFGDNAKLNFDGEPGGRLLDIQVVVDSAPPDADLYCCGPTPMLAAFEAATADLPEKRVHVEYFKPKEETREVSGGFTVVLARQARQFFVPSGQSILQTLLDAGIEAPHSCTEGVCGTCQVTVLDGIPDHRDVILTRDQHASNRTMLICRSGAKNSRLVLDI
jgi:tetrachlorobenzoquinone reductase